MVEVTARSANWRLFGGGGLLLGGVLLLVGALLASSVGEVAFWLTTVGYIVVGLALLFVAFGQTGSNGAVGASGLGKFVLVVAGAAAIVLGVLALLGRFGVALPEVIATVVLIVFVVALLTAAVIVYGRGVARGFAKWALFVPAVAGILLVVDRFADIGGGTAWPAIVFAVVLLLTGLAYLFNRADLKTA